MVWLVAGLRFGFWLGGKGRVSDRVRIRVRVRVGSTCEVQLGESIQITSGHILESHALVLIVDLDGVTVLRLELRLGLVLGLGFTLGFG